MTEFMLLFSHANKQALGEVRCVPHLQAAETAEYIYLRGKIITDIAIQQLPAQKRYHLDEKGLLFPVNRLTPVGKLPELDWQSLTNFLPVEMPVAAMPGKLPEKEIISLVPTEEVHEGYALLTSLADWKAWAETAPAIRLERLQFAVSAQNEVLITGQPLPALPGREYWMQHHVFIPAGYAFEYTVLPEIIATELNADKDSWIVFDTTGGWQPVPLNAFVPASRSAIRMTEFVK
jgi:hypothetical protein